MRSLAAAVMLIGLVIAGHAESQTLRSDLPLWHDDQGAEDIYPQNFFNEDTFGCEHAIWPGLYTFTPTDGERYPEVWRLQNYGVVHCAIVYGLGDTVDEAASNFISHAWIVKLGEARQDEQIVRLLALQIGVRQGSEYVLLAHRVDDDSAPVLDVLDAPCPANARRDQARIDLWSADNCVISSQDMLRTMAREALGRATLGQLAYIEDDRDSGAAPEADAPR